MATRMQQRRGTAAEWLNADPILAEGEIGFETDTGYFKIGDGVNFWFDLPYFQNSDGLSASFDDYVPLTQKGAANGVAELDATGNVPASQLANATVDLTGYATETYVDTAVSNLIDSAPGTLDTLNELAAALNDDANFYTTITNSIASKANLDSPTFTGMVTLPSTTSIGSISSTELSRLDGVTSSIQTQLNNKRNISNTDFLDVNLTSSNFQILPTRLTVEEDSGLKVSTKSSFLYGNRNNAFSVFVEDADVVSNPQQVAAIDQQGNISANGILVSADAYQIHLTPNDYFSIQLPSDLVFPAALGGKVSDTAPAPLPTLAEYDHLLSASSSQQGTLELYATSPSGMDPERLVFKELGATTGKNVYNYRSSAWLTARTYQLNAGIPAENSVLLFTSPNWYLGTLTVFDELTGGPSVNGSNIVPGLSSGDHVKDFIAFRANNKDYHVLLIDSGTEVKILMTDDGGASWTTTNTSSRFNGNPLGPIGNRLTMYQAGNGEFPTLISYSLGGGAQAAFNLANIIQFGDPLAPLEDWDTDNLGFPNDPSFIYSTTQKYTNGGSFFSVKYNPSPPQYEILTGGLNPATIGYMSVPSIPSGAMVEPIPVHLDFLPDSENSSVGKVVIIDAPGSTNMGFYNPRIHISNSIDISQAFSFPTITATTETVSKDIGSQNFVASYYPDYTKIITFKELI